MLKISDYEVMGFRLAIKGMRNALKSWDKSDSKYCYSCMTMDDIPGENVCNYICRDSPFKGYLKIGEADMKLCKRLIKAGPADRKFMRMIHLQAEVTAPLYWWKEYDTYKVGTTANSESTMHTIHKEELSLDKFSLDDFEGEFEGGNLNVSDCLVNFVTDCEMYRKKYLETKDKRYWRALIQLLPSSFNQMRTIDLDYETLMSIYFQRRHHKLGEWHTFCSFIESLPYMKEFIEAVEG